jgi:kinesin family protein 5
MTYLIVCCISYKYRWWYSNTIFIPATKVNLQVKEEKGGRGFFVSDLTEVYVASDAEVYRILKLGNANKKISSTSKDSDPIESYINPLYNFLDMNSDSSRSHTILSMTITQRNVITSQMISSKLYIVDLAGSEKVYKTAASGLRLEEAKSINQSLATLGKVINALTDKNSVHIPYRESKLTKLLQDALGGNSRTTLLINCSPSSFNEEETVSTLRFGLSAKSIKNKPKVNLEISADEVRRKLKESLVRIEELELQNATLETELIGLRQDLSNNTKLSHVNNLLLQDLQNTVCNSIIEIQ